MIAACCHDFGIDFRLRTSTNFKYKAAKNGASLETYDGDLIKKTAWTQSFHSFDYFAFFVICQKRKVKFYRWIIEFPYFRCEEWSISWNIWWRFDQEDSVNPKLSFFWLFCIFRYMPEEKGQILQMDHWISVFSLV